MTTVEVYRRLCPQSIGVWERKGKSIDCIKKQMNDFTCFFYA